jgi:histidine triad (HIT) family protein
MSEDCIFCRIIDGRSTARFIYQDEDVVVIEDLSPKAPRHYLIIPRLHVPTVMDLDGAPPGLSGAILKAARIIARDEGFAADGFRLVVNCNRDGGQTVWHLHVHLLAGRHFSWPPG